MRAFGVAATSECLAYYKAHNLNAMAIGRSTKEKPIYSGFLLAFEPRRTEKIAEQLNSTYEAAESFSAMDWEFEQREVVLLALDPGESSIGGAALMERMHGSGGTGNLMMRLSDPVLLGKSIDAGSIRGVLSLSENVSTAERLKRIDPAVWSKLIVEIKQLRPESSEALDGRLAKREEDRRLLGDTARIARLVEQRDAVGLTLDIASVDRQATLRSLDAGRVDDARSVLDLLDSEPLHEQDLIRHDGMIFKELLNDAMRHAQFKGSGGRSVRVHIYDKKSLETVLGIDLLIYQEIYRSFLLIQYKTMDKIAGKRGQTWSYLIDEQIHKQISAMDAAEAAIQRQSVQLGGIWDWRLHASPFYFKFCERTRANARDDSLVRGILLGLDHLEHFLFLPESEGEDGGRRIGYENCPRYLSNTQFVELARDGWIGCEQKGLALITQLLKSNQEGGKLTMLAVIEGIAPVDARHRGRQWK